MTTAPVRFFEMNYKPVWIIVMTATAFAVGFAIVAIVAVSRTLPAAIAMGLATTAPAQDSGWLIIVHSPPTGVLRGVQLSLLGLLLGGVPAAILATVLAAWPGPFGPRWSAGWWNVFLGGFVFQLSNLVLSVFLLRVLYLTAPVPMTSVDFLLIAGPLILNVVCSMWGLRMWRRLQAATYDRADGHHRYC